MALQAILLAGSTGQRRIIHVPRRSGDPEFWIDLRGKLIILIFGFKIAGSQELMRGCQDKGCPADHVPGLGPENEAQESSSKSPTEIADLVAICSWRFAIDPWGRYRMLRVGGACSPWVDPIWPIIAPVSPVGPKGPGRCRWSLSPRGRRCSLGRMGRARWWAGGGLGWPADRPVRVLAREPA